MMELDWLMLHSFDDLLDAIRDCFGFTSEDFEHCTKQEMIDCLSLHEENTLREYMF